MLVPSDDGPNRLKGVNGIRALASIAVFVFHLLGSAHPSWYRGAIQRWSLQLGPQGVAVFFTLSAFLLYRPYALRILANQPLPLMRNYFLRRSFRIFPGYWLALAGAAVLGSSGFHDRVDIVSSVFLVQTFRRLSEFVGVGVAWTLAIEVSFYIMLPIFAFAVRWAGSRLSTVRARLFVQVGGIVSFMGVGASVRAWYLWQHQTQLVVRGQWFTVDAIQVSLPWFVECFAGGLALAVASAYAERSGHIWSPLRLLTHRSSLSWALALGVLAGAAQFRIGGFGAIPIGNAATFLLVPIHGLCAFLFVLPAVFDDGDDDTIARFLGARVMRSLGAISFGVYLWHLTLLRVMTHWVRDGTIHAPSLLLWIAFAVPATLIAASASYLFVERPCIRASHTFERRLRRTQRELHRPRTER